MRIAFIVKASVFLKNKKNKKNFKHAKTPVSNRFLEKIKK